MGFLFCKRFKDFFFIHSAFFWTAFQCCHYALDQPVPTASSRDEHVHKPRGIFVFPGGARGLICRLALAMGLLTAWGWFPVLLLC